MSHWKNGRCLCFTFFLSSITRIISLTESPTSLYKRMQFLSSSVITQLVGRKRILEGDNNSWLWSTTKIVICHSFGKMSIDFRNTIVRQALHLHFQDILFHYSLDGSTIFSDCLPSQWQKKLRLPISSFFFFKRPFRIVKRFRFA